MTCYDPPDLERSENHAAWAQPDSKSYASFLVHFLLGGLALLVCSLTGSLLIATAHSFAYIYHLGPPDAETQALLSRVIITTNRYSWLWMCTGTCLMAVLSFARHRAPSRILILPLAFGAWLSALPFTLNVPEDSGLVPQVGRFMTMLLVSYLGSVFGRAYRRRVNRKLDAIFRIRHASSPEKLVLRLQEALERRSPRIMLLSSDAPESEFLRVEADSLGQIPPGTTVTMPHTRTVGAGKGPVSTHSGQLPDGSAPLGSDARWYRLRADESGCWVLLVGAPNGTWFLRPSACEHLIEHVEASLRQQAMVGYAREQERARERRQMSYELHDTLTQDLVSGILELDTVRSHLGDGPDEVKRALDAVERALRDSLQVSREMAFKYHDEPNAPKDVRVDLESVVDEFRRSEKIAVKFEPVGKIIPTTNDRISCLKAALREGLSNVKKHSRASFVQVTFSQMERGYALDVRDDGRGMSVSPLTSLVGRGGFGLVALRQRVEALGGRMIIESAPMQGTTLSIQFPGGAEPAA